MEDRWMKDGRKDRKDGRKDGKDGFTTKKY